MTAKDGEARQKRLLQSESPRVRQGDDIVDRLRQKDSLFPVFDEAISREEKIKRIKKLVEDDQYITDELLDKAIANLLDEIERD